MRCHREDWIPPFGHPLLSAIKILDQHELGCIFKPQNADSKTCGILIPSSPPIEFPSILSTTDGNRRETIQIGVTHVIVSSLLQVGGNESHIHYYLGPRRLARTTSIRHDCLSFFSQNKHGMLTTITSNHVRKCDHQKNFSITHLNSWPTNFVGNNSATSVFFC